jgi:transcriptional regulator with XRE-family HTH domain
MISRLWEKMKDPQYRRAFVASQISIGIPFQIRALLKSRSGWTQETLAEHTGMLQPRISGLMTPGRTRPNIETLRRIAEAFDCGLMVRFVPFSDLARWSEEFDPEWFHVPSFANDAMPIERKPVGVEEIFDTIPMVAGGTNGTFRHSRIELTGREFQSREETARMLPISSTATPPVLLEQSSARKLYA